MSEISDVYYKTRLKSWKIKQSKLSKKLDRSEYEDI